MLELEGDRCISSLTYLPTEQMVPLPEMKLSIVDVQCVNERGREYVVEMQLFNVQGFEERVVYNACRLVEARDSSGSNQATAPVAHLLSVLLRILD